MESLIMRPKNKEQLTALEAVAKALKVPFEKHEDPESTEREKGIRLYGLEVVEAVEQAEIDIRNGLTTRIKKEDLKDFLGLA